MTSSVIPPYHVPALSVALDYEPRTRPLLVLCTTPPRLHCGFVRVFLYALHRSDSSLASLSTVSRLTVPP